jgi:hypothetical protein
VLENVPDMYGDWDVRIRCVQCGLDLAKPPSVVFEDVRQNLFRQTTGAKKNVAPIE